jgi:DNA-binding XRE family transcriptional regulator
VSGTSPVVRQRELGIRLRALRNERGLTVEEVAAELLCSTTKISRLETAARRPSPDGECVTLSRGEWRVFVAGVKDGDFDDL